MVYNGYHDTTNHLVTIQIIQNEFKNIFYFMYQICTHIKIIPKKLLLMRYALEKIAIL